MILFPAIMWLAGTVALFAMPPAVILFWGAALVYFIVAYIRSPKRNQDKRAKKVHDQKVKEANNLNKWAEGVYQGKDNDTQYALDCHVKENYDPAFLRNYLFAYKWQEHFPIAPGETVDMKRGAVV
jgi:hypothetical protein